MTGLNDWVLNKQTVFFILNFNIEYYAKVTGLLKT